MKQRVANIARDLIDAMKRGIMTYAEAKAIHDTRTARDAEFDNQAANEAKAIQRKAPRIFSKPYENAK